MGDGRDMLGGIQVAMTGCDSERQQCSHEEVQRDAQGGANTATERRGYKKGVPYHSPVLHDTRRFYRIWGLTFISISDIFAVP